MALIGPSRAKQFVIFGDKVEAGQAHERGLADGEALAAARRWAEKIAKLPPNALSHATTFMDDDQYALATTSEDYKEAVRAFLEKRDPNFTGR